MTAKDKIARLQEYNENLKEVNERLFENLDELEESNVKLTRDKSKLRTCVKGLKEENASLKEFIAKLHAKIFKLENPTVGDKSKRADVIDSLTFGMKALEEENVRLKSAIEQMEDNDVIAKIAVMAEYKRKGNMEFIYDANSSEKKEMTRGLWVAELDGQIVYDSGKYFVGKDSLLDKDWFIHLMKKGFFDFNDFIPVYFQALKNIGIKEFTMKILH